MGQKQAAKLAEAPAEWERRKAEQAERTAAAMEDPVSRFHRRHGRPVRRRAPDADTADEAEREDSGPA